MKEYKLIKYTKIISIFFFTLLAHLAYKFIPDLHSNQISFSGQDYKGEPLDYKLLKILNFKNGVFIEVGAHDGLSQSNTMLLEEFYNWKGILVEPSSNIFKRLCNNRPKSYCFNCALGTFEQDNTYIFGNFDGSLMSSIGGIREHQLPNEYVLIRSLQSILDEVKIHRINFFSLDVEG